MASLEALLSNGDTLGAYALLLIACGVLWRVVMAKDKKMEELRQAIEKKLDVKDTELRDSNRARRRDLRQMHETLLRLSRMQTRKTARRESMSYNADSRIPAPLYETRNDSDRPESDDDD